MTLDEYKIFMAFETMKVIAAELGWQEINTKERFWFINNLNPDYFIGWKYNQKEVVCFHTQDGGLAYMIPAEGVTATHIDSWRDFLAKALKSLRPDQSLESSLTWREKNAQAQQDD